VVLGVPMLILVLPPVGLVLGFLNLQRRYPDRPALSEPREALLTD
jgi:hypothetical protein